MFVGYASISFHPGKVPPKQSISFHESAESSKMKKDKEAIELCQVKLIYCLLKPKSKYDTILSGVPNLDESCSRISYDVQTVLSPQSYDYENSLFSFYCCISLYLFLT